MTAETGDTDTRAPAGADTPELSGERFWPLFVLWAVVPLVIAGLMAYYLLLCRQVVGEFGFPLDDGWIHVRFAQNIARGYGFTFNPGEPTSLTTGPLWTILLGLAYRLTGEYILTSAVMNWVFCWLAALAAAALAQTFVPSRAFGAAAALVVAATIPLPWLALSGMEPPLFMWLTLVAVLLHVRLRQASGIKAIVPAVAIGVAVTARPENLLLFPLAMLDRLLMVRYERPGWPGVRLWLKQLAVHTPIFLLIISPVVIHNYNATGRPLPSSYYIKAMNFGVTWAIVMKSNALLFQSMVVAPIKEFFAILALWAGNNLVLFVPFLFGYYQVIRRAGALRTGPHFSFLIPLVLAVQPTAWAMSTNFHRAPWFQGQRYVANLGPLYIIVGLAGGWWLLRQRRPESFRTVLPVAFALVLAASLVRQPDQAKLFTHNVKNITDMQVTTARWLKETVPPDSMLVLNDVGAIAAITDMPIFDTIGLVSADSLACRTIENARTGQWLRCVWDTAESKTPDYLVVVMKPERYEGFVRAGHKPIFSIKIDDNITCGGPWIVVYTWREKPPERLSSGVQGR
ncbi:MAG TPA: hypothetical protein VMY87_03295 [Armatimonadota bacterium]|nr:hypothetical protein [Armatimonadota bacterium]